jgi:hypothetical protein
MALITIAVVSFSAASVLYMVNNRNQSSANSGSWQEALSVAESGSDLAMTSLNASLASPATAWTGWTPSDAATFPKTYKGSLPAHTGEGNNKMYTLVTIDSPLRDTAGNPWYRIRSTGTTEIPGLRRVGYNPTLLSTTGAKHHGNFLRKIAYNSDATGGALHTPQTSRTIEVIAQPVSTGLFSHAVLVEKSITLNGGAFTDSYDPTDPAKSTNGQYDAAKRQGHGSIASNSNGSLSKLNKMYVYGNASSNAGAMVDTQNVQGTLYNNYSTSVAAVSDPTFSSSTVASINNPKYGVTLTGGTATSPANYVVSNLTVSKSAAPLILAPAVTGQESYINIWVQGPLNVSGSGYIQQLPGVHVTFWVDGNISFGGTAFDNENTSASYLMINGVTPASGPAPTININGNASFVGVVNAPAYNLNISGGGNFSGAFIVQSATLNGKGGFHYDESLGSLAGGGGHGYKMASWVEDIR